VCHAIAGSIAAEVEVNSAGAGVGVEPAHEGRIEGRAFGYAEAEAIHQSHIDLKAEGPVELGLHGPGEGVNTLAAVKRPAVDLDGQQPVGSGPQLEIGIVADISGFEGTVLDELDEGGRAPQHSLRRCAYNPNRVRSRTHQHVALAPVCWIFKDL